MLRVACEPVCKLPLRTFHAVAGEAGIFRNLNSNFPQACLLLGMCVCVWEGGGRGFFFGVSVTRLVVQLVKLMVHLFASLPGPTRMLGMCCCWEPAVNLPRKLNVSHTCAQRKSASDSQYLGHGFFFFVCDERSLRSTRLWTYSRSTTSATYSRSRMGRTKQRKNAKRGNQKLVTPLKGVCKNVLRPGIGLCEGRYVFL